MRMAQTIAEPLEEQLYAFDELRWHLAKYRGSRLPPSTLRDWLKVLRIEPNEFGMFDSSDLRWLIRYSQWLKRGGTSKGFQAIQEKELSHAS
jgi:hypothetical protein